MSKREPTTRDFMEASFARGDFPIFSSEVCPKDVIYMMSPPAKMKLEAALANFGPFTSTAPAQEALSLTAMERMMHPLREARQVELARIFSPLTFGLDVLPRTGPKITGLFDPPEPTPTLASPPRSLHLDTAMALLLLLVGCIGSAVYWIFFA